MNMNTMDILPEHLDTEKDTIQIAEHKGLEDMIMIQNTIKHHEKITMIPGGEVKDTLQYLELNIPHYFFPTDQLLWEILN